MVHLTVEEVDAWQSASLEQRAKILSEVRMRTGAGFRELLDSFEMREIGITEKDLTPLALYKAIQSLRRELLG